jgi:CheY-like chemotaxis protein
MNRVIEADFLPHQPEADFSWPDSTATSRVNEKRRILIVDNDTNATHLVRILLEKTGQYLVLEENNSTNAYRSALIFRPDLILLDVVMPIRDGGEIAAQIRADPELQNTPIIFLTALVTPSEARAGVHIDGHPFLAKPINIQELIRTIEEHLFPQAKLFGQSERA